MSPMGAMTMGMGLGSAAAAPTPYVPAWAVGSDLWLDFQANYGRDEGEAVALATLITDTHAQAILANNAAGAYSSFATNVLVRTNAGLQTVPTRTNVALHNRDLTNAAWVKSNTTAAKNQTGILGVANGASSLTATAGNGTCLQAITLASSERFQTAFVKRLVGTGVVNMTMDNGSTWTAVTVTSDWTRVSIPTQTLANPTVGFRLVTSGDSIAIDYVQNENGIFASQPIEVAGTAVTVNGDQQVISSLGSQLANGVYGFVQFDCRDPGAGFVRAFEINTGVSSANRFSLNHNAGNIEYGLFSESASQAGATIGVWAVGVNTIAFATSATFNRCQRVGDSATATDTSATYPAFTQANLGGVGYNAGSNAFQNTRKLALWFGAPDAAKFAAVFALAEVAAA